MRSSLWILALLLLGLVGLTASCDAIERGGDDGDRLEGRVLRVVDGDTLIVRLDGGRRERVRLIGIDAPEIAHDGLPAECWGRRAASGLRAAADGRDVVLEPGRDPRDRYGRLLAYAGVEGSDDLGRDGLERGDARILRIRPNTARAGDYAEVAENARDRGAGLWGRC